MHRTEGLDSNPQTHKLDNVKAVACIHACMHFKSITALRWTCLVLLSLLVKQLNVINPVVADLCHGRRFCLL